MTAHGHPWDESVPCVEIAPDVCLTPIRTVGPDRPHDEGYWFCHDAPGAEVRCAGRVLTLNQRPGGPTWTQTGSLEGGDLTLSPSVLCTFPGHAHGWVRDGKWVPA